MKRGADYPVRVSRKIGLFHPVARGLLLAVVTTIGLLVVTQLPLVPADNPAGSDRLVPLDTWAAATFPATRDFYRSHFSSLTEPKRLPVLGLFVALAAIVLVSFPQRLGAWLATRVPALSPRALGLFRLAFGVALLVALRSEAPTAVPWDLQRSTSWLARLELVRTLAASEAAVYWLWQATSILLAVFAAGLWPRVALVAAAAGMTLFIGTGLTAKAMHDWGVPLLTLWMLTLVPWRDSAGIQSVIARWRGRPLRAVPATHRGMAIWIPGLTLGVALAAAAFAKLDTSGLAWVTSGAVGFHFIEDSRQAPVTWGLLVARSHIVAALLSFGAIVIEAGFWTVVLVRSEMTRAAIGLIGLSMLCGFYLFQGVFWPAWWVLFLAFVPWSTIDRWAGGPAGDRQPETNPQLPQRVRADGDSRSALPATATAAVALLVLQQPMVSALRLESEPFISDYSMYSYTWPSRAAFDGHLAEKTARYELSLDGSADRTIEDRIRQLPRAGDVLGDAIDRSARGEPWPDDTRSAVAAMRRTYQQQFGEPLTRVTVRTLQQRFDWQRGAFDDQPRVVSESVLDLETGHFDDRR